MIESEKKSKNYLNNRQILDKNAEQFNNYLHSFSLEAASLKRGLSVEQLFQTIQYLEEYDDILFLSETHSKDTDYEGWLGAILDFVDDCFPYFRIVVIDGVPLGAFWALNFGGMSGKTRECDFGGLARRGVDPLLSLAASYAFLDLLFSEHPDLFIIRGEFTEKNRAVARLLYRLGFSHPETRRAIAVKDNQGITGTILSVTRPEWDALHDEKRERIESV